MLQGSAEVIDISTAVVTAATQTYSGSAKTPTPTVTLNGSTVPSSGYDVTYSNNTNAGTATITITGKGDYTGTATGTFTINKATPSYIAPTYRTLTYNGGNQYLTTTGSTSDGTIKYSLDGVNWYTTRRQGSTAGTYTSYWKLEGDSNHTDINATSISTTIAKASRTLSFTDSYMVLNTSSTGTKTATPSAGSGDGAITYSIANTTYATINSSTGAVTSKTSDGSVIVTATIAAGTNYLSASASYTLYVFATTHNYSYSGSAKNVTLPPGTYKFQCWGAQGGSNATDSTYGITAQTGGKGGYAEGQITLADATAMKVYVGGQGTSSAAGWNGGGSTTGSSTYNASSTRGVSKMGGGGGATDIRLSDGALLSRMIVAGGGSGGAMCYKGVTSSQTVQDARSTQFVLDYPPNHYVMKCTPVVAGRQYTIKNNGSTMGVVTKLVYDSGGYTADGTLYTDSTFIHSVDYIPCSAGDTIVWKYSSGDTLAWIDLLYYDSNKNVISYNGMTESSGSRTLTAPANTAYIRASFFASYVSSASIKINGTTVWTPLYSAANTKYTVNSRLYHSFFPTYHANYDQSDRIGSIQTDLTFTAPTGAQYMDVFIYRDVGVGPNSIEDDIANLDIRLEHSETTITETRESQAGYYGGGTTGGGYSSTYRGKQGSAGNGGAFGTGANQITPNYRYCSGAGGGGWYGGGGGQRSDSSMTYVHYSGGGSGFVNTAASAGNRPSGYTGLELDSGTTYAGNTSFPSTGGGTETGHSGNGYVRITRL